jgi:hypothetical protein
MHLIRTIVELRATVHTKLVSARCRSTFPVLLFWAVGEGQRDAGF